MDVNNSKRGKQSIFAKTDDVKAIDELRNQIKEQFIFMK
ncbi:MAG: hypothetical protein ACJA2M_001881 [Polaribacter sp.]|jgi:hypothetical protein